MKTLIIPISEGMALCGSIVLTEDELTRKVFPLNKFLWPIFFESNGGLSGVDDENGPKVNKIGTL